MKEMDAVHLRLDGLRERVEATLRDESESWAALGARSVPTDEGRHLTFMGIIPMDPQRVIKGQAPGDGPALCPADWGSATPTQRCTLPDGHAGDHRDARGRWEPSSLLSSVDLVEMFVELIRKARLSDLTAARECGTVARPVDYGYALPALEMMSLLARDTPARVTLALAPFRVMLAARRAVQVVCDEETAAQTSTTVTGRAAR